MRLRDVLVSLAVSTLLPSATGLLLTPGSPCAKHCGNVLSSTTGADMECFDNPAQYGTTSVGNVFQNCLTCQMTSSYSNQGQTDLQWLIYNLRFSTSYCLFNFPENTKKVNSGPCITSTACGPLREAIQWQNLTTSAGQYDFCQLWRHDQLAKCTTCLHPGDHYIMTNFMVMLDAACQQLPIVGHTISVSQNPFTTTLITATEPTPTGYVFVPESGPLTLAAKVGIGAAGVVLILVIAGFGIVCNGKRRRRAYLRELEKRHAHAQGGGNDRRWPGGGHNGGGDMFETPVSQRPLFGGWETSPVSAHTDQMSTGLSPAVEQGAAGPSNFPSRYFSPYSSNYNSPVSAQETSAMMQWPSQEKLAHLVAMEQERERQEQLQAHMHMHSQNQNRGISPLPQDIGLALGGDDPSLRSKKSEQSFQSSSQKRQQQQEQQGDSDGTYYPPPPPGPPPTQQQQQRSYQQHYEQQQREYERYQQQHQQKQQQQQQEQQKPQWSPDVKGKHRDVDEHGWGADVKGKSREHEEYELHEVDSNGSLRVPSAPAPPVLHHPGFGRFPPQPAPTRQQWV